MSWVRRYKIEILIGIGIVLLYFFLRVYNLTVIPVFADEAIYIRWAQIMEHESTLRFLPLSDGKQPLFMWAVIPFLKIISDPLMAGRMVSVVTGFGTLIGIFLLTFYLFKRVKIALIAAFLYTISPFTVFFDRMALADSMLTMFGVWVLLLGILTARTLRLDFAMLTGFALGGALLTKSPALFYSILIPLNIAFAPIFKKTKVFKISFVKLVKFIGLLSVTYIMGYAIYSVLRLGANFHLIAQRNQDYVLPLSHLWTRPLDPFLPYVDRSKEWLLILGPAGLIILALLGAILGIKKFPKEIIILIIWAVFPILVQSEFAKAITARYILFSLPPTILLAASVFKSSNKWIGKLSLILLIFIIYKAVNTDFYLLTKPGRADLPQSERSGYLEEWTAGTGIRESAEVIKAEYIKNPDKKIVVGTEGFFGTLPDGLQIYLKDYPQIIVIGVGLNFKTVPKSLLESREFGNKTYLVVNSSRFNEMFKTNDYTKLGLTLVASYPKVKRARNDTHEFLFYGERDILYLFEVTEASVTLSEKEQK